MYSKREDSEAALYIAMDAAFVCAKRHVKEENTAGKTMAYSAVTKARTRGQISQCHW